MLNPKEVEVRARMLAKLQLRPVLANDRRFGDPAERSPHQVKTNAIEEFVARVVNLERMTLEEVSVMLTPSAKAHREISERATF